MHKACDCKLREQLRVVSGSPAPNSVGFCQYCAIERCVTCGKLVKWRYRYLPGMGGDHFCLEVGETERGMTFTRIEALGAEVERLRLQRDRAWQTIGKIEDVLGGAYEPRIAFILADAIGLAADDERNEVTSATGEAVCPA